MDTEAARAEAITALIEAGPRYTAACAAHDAAYRKYQFGEPRFDRAALSAAIDAYDAALKEITADAIAAYDSAAVDYDAEVRAWEAGEEARERAHTGDGSDFYLIAL